MLIIRCINCHNILSVGFQTAFLLQAVFKIFEAIIIYSS